MECASLKKCLLSPGNCNRDNVKDKVVKIDKEPRTPSKKGNDKVVDSDLKQESVKIEQKIILSKDKEENQKRTLDLEEGIARGKNILLAMQTKIANLYQTYFSNTSISYTAKEIVLDLENYLQALLLVASTKNKELQESEMNFIWSVLYHADIFEGTNSIEEAITKAKNIVDKNPQCLMLTVGVDRYYEKNETKALFVNIYNLYLVTCAVSGALPIKKEELFAQQINFARAQGVII